MVEVLAWVTLYQAFFSYPSENIELIFLVQRKESVVFFYLLVKVGAVFRIVKESFLPPDK